MTWMGRTLGEFQPLWPAEQKLVEEMGTGRFVSISRGLPPEDAPHEHRVRASFLRYLALGGCEACRPPDKGVRVFGALIEGNGPDGAATRGLDLDCCKISGSLALARCRFPDLVVLNSASVSSLSLMGSTLHRGLAGDGLTAKGFVFLNNGFVAKGEVRLFGARVGGSLYCDRGRFLAEGDAGGTPLWPLVAEGLDVQGSVFLRDGFEATGAVRLSDAKIGGVLSCSGGTFKAAEDGQGDPGLALVAERLEVTGTVFLSDAFQARGEVRLRHSSIGGNLDCAGGSFQAEKDERGWALAADGLEAKGDVRLSNGFTAIGQVWMHGARIGGNLDCRGGKFRARQDTSRRDCRALHLEGVHTVGGLLLREGTCIEGVLDLTAADVGTLAEAPEAWPQPGELLLNRFRYGAITNGPVDAATRLRWLELQESSRWRVDFWPQPYEQIAKVLREMGHWDDARVVLIENERRQRAARQARATPGWRRWFVIWDGMLDHSIRFGQQPLRAFAWLAVFWLAGWWVFGLAATQDAIKPSSPVVLRSPEWVLCNYPATASVPFGAAGVLAAGRAAPRQSQRACYQSQPEAESYPGFNAAFYSLDTLLPVASLQQQEFWVPDGTKRYGSFAWIYLWLHILAGWALRLLAVAGFSGLVKSDRT